ncbi:MAG TPA: SDR family NAD(P)-dependent oxidoreductase [Bryobacteraceae bacterium]|nr:SDR family NAD(P)-dependent oxidoreductase [Bryobacteraceae bacterium]
MEQRVVLVTGASSGIGHACARQLAERGFRVFGTSRMAGPKEGPVRMLRMDVTDDASVLQGVDAILQSEGRLDIVVNNAGIAVAGPLESTSLDEARRLLDVNLLGVFRVCRAVLPWMRRQGGGFLVDISSIGGLIGIPYQPFYSASKFALEGLSESLRLEARPFGVRVVLIEPGDTRTPITRHRTVAADAATNRLYPAFPAALERMASDEQQGPGPERVARLLCRIVNHPRPRLRYTTGPPAQRAAVWLKRLMPYTLLEYGMRRYYGLKH